MTCSPQKRDFCNQSEFIFFVDHLDNDYVQEADVLPMSLELTLTQIEPTTLKIIRMDKETWKGEDVTEEVANAWLDQNQPTPEDELLPDFVADSDAWETYKASFEDAYGASSEPTLDDMNFEKGIGKHAKA